LVSRGSDQRASRGEIRAMPTVPPSPSPTPSKARPSVKPSPKVKASPKVTASKTPPAGGGTVVSSGTCGASFYSDGQQTANGEAFDPNGFTAANKTLPFDTRVKVTNQANGESVVVRINDRGPFVADRCLDLSRAAFESIASLGAGVITVRYQVLS
jgi:rare lipoprotein A